MLNNALGGSVAETDRDLRQSEAFLFIRERLGQFLRDVDFKQSAAFDRNISSAAGTHGLLDRSDFGMNVDTAFKFGLVSVDHLSAGKFCVFFPECLGAAAAMFFLECTIGPSWAVPMDIGGEVSGTVSGMINMAGNIGGALSPIVFD